MTTSAERHDEMVRASDEQRQRLRTGTGLPGFARWDSAAARFRADPRRELDENLQLIASMLEPDDTLVDVGGGSGRYGLPLALRCREVINVEPSVGMGREFVASATEAGISNARNVNAEWLDARDVTGDVSLVVHVTYFVPHIQPFIEELVSGSRKRVIIGVGSTPPPNQGADLFRFVEAEPQALVPGHRELLDVLWDMGILPEVRVGGSATGTAIGGMRIYASREEALDSVARPAEMENEHVQRTRRAAEEHFDEIFAMVEGGYERRSARGPRLLLITWETAG